MPELAEVEFFRRQWSAGHGDKIVAVHVHERARIFRGCDVAQLKTSVTGSRLVGSETAAKQMLFRFHPSRAGRGWLGIHLGMSGELRVEAPGFAAGRHDHLVLAQKARSLVFNDPRMFGAVLYSDGPTAPAWWTDIAPAILSPAFTEKAVADFFRRRARAPIKAVLLMQERFPGIGNWMADEILWRAAVHPRRLAGSLRPREIHTLRLQCRWVCRHALMLNGGLGRPLPPRLNANIPRSWLFWHRWEDGGVCPRTGQPLARAVIGGRMTCWSPARQKLR